MVKFERSFIRIMSRFSLFLLSIQKDRRSQVVTKGLVIIMGASINLHITRKDLGEGFFTPEFLLVLMLWVIIALIVFVDELQRAKEKTTSEKVDALGIKVDGTNTRLDTLITNINTLVDEIRQERNERKTTPK